MVRKKRLDMIISSVTKIQAAFRNWRMIQYTKRRVRGKLEQEISNVNWDIVLKNEATFKERMYIWRSIIELRRAHPHFSTDVCLRALILAEGDLHRALIIISNPEFHLSAQASPDLSFEQRCLFLPYIDGITGKEERIALRKRAKERQKEKEILRAHRHLHNTLQYSKSNYFDSSPLHIPMAIDVSNAVYKSYFSKKYIGHNLPMAVKLLSADTGNKKR
jgi:pullulanase/glycogen debranching enzyme